MLYIKPTRNLQRGFSFLSSDMKSRYIHIVQDHHGHLYIHNRKKKREVLNQITKEQWESAIQIELDGSKKIVSSTASPTSLECSVQLRLNACTDHGKARCVRGTDRQEWRGGRGGCEASEVRWSGTRVGAVLTQSRLAPRSSHVSCVSCLPHWGLTGMCCSPQLGHLYFPTVDFYNSPIAAASAGKSQ